MPIPRELGRRTEFLDAQLARLDEMIVALVTARAAPILFPASNGSSANGNDGRHVSTTVRLPLRPPLPDHCKYPRRRRPAPRRPQEGTQFGCSTSSLGGGPAPASCRSPRATRDAMTAPARTGRAVLPRRACSRRARSQSSTLAALASCGWRYAPHLTVIFHGKTSAPIRRTGAESSAHEICHLRPMSRTGIPCVARQCRCSRSTPRYPRAR